VDVDLDAPETIALASTFLPQTAMRHGRATKPSSHYWYVADPIPRTAQFRDVDGVVLVELRSTRSFTVVPPSIHPSRERLEWQTIGPPASVRGHDLHRGVATLAACALIARHWPEKGSRHRCDLALAGTLLRLAIPEQEALTFVQAALKTAGDEEWEDRGRDVLDTAQTLAEDRPATGGPTLAELLRGEGAKVVTLLRRWLQPSPAGLQDEKTFLNAADGDLARLASAAWTALRLANQPPFLLRHGTNLVRVTRVDDNTTA
jgi:hypothetical protein